MESHGDPSPDVTRLQSANPPLLNHGGVLNWKDKLPPVDPNPAPASSPTTEERAIARPATDTGQKRNPWLHDGNLKIKPIILKSDLVLPNVQVNVDGDVLCLAPEDYVPITASWGYCLLGFMAGKFPGRDAIERLTLTWPWPARVAFHPIGWMVFRFEITEDMEAAKSGGNLAVFGTPLMLCTMPADFNFDKAPEFKFKVWASLPGLQLELWQPSTLAKIANMVGTPIEVDHRTVARVNIDGPRIHVMVDAKTPPPEFIKIKLPSGKIVNQKIVFDFYPTYCTHCRHMGHVTAVCRRAGKTYPDPRSNSRGFANAETAPSGPDDKGWQQVCRRKGRNEKAAPTAGAGRGASRPPQ